MKCKVVYYQTTNGRYPVFEFIEGLSDIAQAKVSDTFSLLMEFGYKLGGSHSKKLSGTRLWELRVLGNDSLRFLYALEGGRAIMLHGFKKKRQKIEKKDMNIALNRLREL